MPRTQTFIRSAELYDAIYSFKNYARESERLPTVINQVGSGAHTLLDVACGTGERAQFLKQHYAVDGIDLNDDYLRAARLKNPAGNYTPADMMDFDLGCTYDVVCSLFSAIGIVKTFARRERAIACMVRHIRPGGALIIEPWFTPDQWHPARPFILAGAIGDDNVYRISNILKEGQLSVLLHNYLRGTTHGVEHYSERIELGLFTRDEMTWAFEFSGMETWYDPEGLMGRGLYLGRRP